MWVCLSLCVVQTLYKFVDIAICECVVQRGWGWGELQIDDARGVWVGGKGRKRADANKQPTLMVSFSLNGRPSYVHTAPEEPLDKPLKARCGREAPTGGW